MSYRDGIILPGNALDMRELLAARSVHCVICSPPYWGLRAEGDDPFEVGRKSLEEYIEELVVFAGQVWRVLRWDGLFWLNLGDTYSGSGGAGGDYLSGGSKDGEKPWKQGDAGIADMQACLVPYKVANRLQESGWLVRQVIVWDKTQVRPEQESHVRRPLFAHETILMLAKDPGHRYFAGRLPELGNVWHFPPVKGPRFHSAPFPTELPRRCILASTEEGDLVFDPFAGSGTTLKVARELGRRSLGLDLYAPAPTLV